MSLLFTTRCKARVARPCRAVENMGWSAVDSRLAETLTFHTRRSSSRTKEVIKMLEVADRFALGSTSSLRCVLVWKWNLVHAGSCCRLSACAAGLPDAEHAESSKSWLMKKWKMYVHYRDSCNTCSWSVAFTTTSSCRPPKHRDEGGLYHALIGTKILIALAIFFIASALVGRSKSTRKECVGAALKFCSN